MLGLLFLASFSFRLAVWDLGLLIRSTDERDYVTIASNLKTSGSFSAGPDRYWEERYRSALFPYLIAPMIGQPPSERFVRLFLVIMASLFPLIAFGLGLAVGLPRWGCWLTGLFAAIHPFHIRFSAVVVPDALATCTLAVTYALAFAALRPSLTNRGKLLAQVTSAFTLGVTVALRTNLVFLALPLVLHWAIPLLRRRQAPSVGLFLILAGAVVPLPLVAVRSVQEGRFLPLTDAGTQLFWVGNTAHSLDYLRGVRDHYADFASAFGPVNARRGSTTAPLREALKFISDSPRQWVVMKSKLFWALWAPTPSFDEDPGVRSLGSSQRSFIRIAKSVWRVAIFSTLVIAIVVGFARWHHAASRLMLLAIVLITLFGGLYFPEHKYRMAADIFLPVLALSAFARTPAQPPS